MRMKKILLLTISVLAVCLQVFGQENVNCPTIKLDSPTEQTPISEKMDFSVSLMGKFENRSLEFKWTVSNEINFNGQGTSSISIPLDRSLAEQTITATVEIKGLPEGCKNSFSESREVKIRQIIIQDGHEENTFKGDTPLDDYLARIQNLNLALQGEKGSKSVIIFKFTKLSEKKKAIAMKKKLLKQLKKYKISLDGIEMKIEKGKVYETTFEYIPPKVSIL